MMFWLTHREEMTDIKCPATRSCDIFQIFSLLIYIFFFSVSETFWILTFEMYVT